MIYAQKVFRFNVDDESPSRAFEMTHASGNKRALGYLLQARVARDRHLLICSCALLWLDFVLCLSQVSEVEMRGMLALEMELSVEEILVYRDVAR